MGMGGAELAAGSGGAALGQVAAGDTVIGVFRQTGRISLFGDVLKLTARVSTALDTRHCIIWQCIRHELFGGAGSAPAVLSQ